jgi:L-2,4-diaminobutyric acid acetyltransferase
MVALGSTASAIGSDRQSVAYGRPAADDGAAMWRLAAATQVLDVNSAYAYVLWCRDFAATSVVARLDGRLVGFVTGYCRPDDPTTLMVWQVAVDGEARGRGVAGGMLDALVERVRPEHLETTVTEDNAASRALFTRFAERHGAPLQRSELFGVDVLGAEHDPEFLHRIGPIPTPGDAAHDDDR